MKKLPYDIIRVKNNEYEALKLTEKEVHQILQDHEDAKKYKKLSHPLSHDCKCKKDMEEIRSSYKLLDINCKVVHDVNDKWHYVVITCGQKTFADFVKNHILSLEKDRQIVKRLKEELKGIKEKPFKYEVACGEGETCTVTEQTEEILQKIRDGKK